MRLSSVFLTTSQLWVSLAHLTPHLHMDFPVAQMVKNLPALWETQVQSLGQEDPLEKGMATHSNILAWRIPWTEEPGGLQSMGSQRVGKYGATNTNQHLHVCPKLYRSDLFFLITLPFPSRVPCFISVLPHGKSAWNIALKSKTEKINNCMRAGGWLLSH